MFYSTQKQEMRTLFFTSWQKFLAKQPLTPLENQLVEVIQDHPEYHALFASSNTKEHDYFPEMGQTNPFLHMGLHLAVRDQLTLDRPKGIAAIYHQLLACCNHPLQVEHLLMECLAECLWQAQRSQALPKDDDYLQLCKKIII